MKSRRAVISLDGRVLVNDVTFKCKHDIGDKWEKNPHMVVSQTNLDIPVYLVAQNQLMVIFHEVADETPQFPPGVVT